MAYQWLVKLACYSGSKISPSIFRSTTYKGRKSIALSLSLTYKHTCTHTEANNGVIIMVTLVMTYTNYFFDLNSPSVATAIKNTLQKCVYSLLSSTNLWKIVYPRQQPPTHSPNRALSDPIPYPCSNLLRDTPDLGSPMRETSQKQNPV